MMKDPRCTLTPEILKNIGFVDSGKDSMGKSQWRLKVPYYGKTIQVVLSDYVATNPNSGILSVVFEEGEAMAFTDTGKNKKVKWDEQVTPIAYYVNTPERLYSIITVLTQRVI